MNSFAVGSLAPMWIVAPMAVVTLLVLAGHVLLMWRADMPASRRRIRVANGLLMMFVVPLSVYALCIADPAQQQREFVLAWMMIVGLVTLVIIVAGVDVVNSWLLHRRDRQRLVQDLGITRKGAADPQPVTPPAM